MSNKISIIIPAYNIESYIASTLDSVLRQSYYDIEVVVVNDGSKDRTGEIVDAYADKDPRVKVVHKENGGVTSARLRGVEEASGEWIGFVDGDDYVEPQMYEKLLNNAMAYSADISHCGYQMVFPNGRVDYYYNTGRLVEQSKISGLIDLISGSFVEPGLWNKLFHKSLFHSLLHDQVMDSKIKINEDLLMNYWLFKAAEAAVYEDFCPYHYVLRKGSAATSKVNEHKLWDPLRVTKIILADAPAEVKPVVFQKLIRQLINGVIMSPDQAPELVKPYRLQAHKELKSHLLTVLQGHDWGIKLKIMAVWAAVWPASYRWVHNTYARITGLDKIYDLD